VLKHVAAAPPKLRLLDGRFNVSFEDIRRYFLPGDAAAVVLLETSRPKPKGSSRPGLARNPRKSFGPRKGNESSLRLRQVFFSLKSMAAPPDRNLFRLLRKLHRIHQQRADLQRQARRGPDGRSKRSSRRSMRQKPNSMPNRGIEKTAHGPRTTNICRLAIPRGPRPGSTNAGFNEAGSNKEFKLLQEQLAATCKPIVCRASEIFEILDASTRLERTARGPTKTRQNARPRRTASARGNRRGAKA